MRTSWPGTWLGGGAVAGVREYKVAPGVAEVLESAVGGLYDWCHSKAPEDIALLRSDGSAILTVTAHEEDAFLTLSREEQQRLVAAIGPELNAYVRWLAPGEP